MELGKSKIANIEFGSLDSEIDKSLQRDDAADSLAMQIQTLEATLAVVKEAIRELATARNELDKSKVGIDHSANVVKDAANTAEHAVGKLTGATIRAKVNTDEWNRLTTIGNRIVADGEHVLDAHRTELSNKMKEHYYDMTNLLSKNEGIWISGKWWYYVLWIVIPCIVYTVVSLSVFTALAFGK